MKRILRYLQGTKKKGLVFNPPKQMVVDCYADAGFARLWVHENTQDPICYSSRTVFVVAFDNFIFIAGIKTTDKYCSL